MQNICLQEKCVMYKLLYIPLCLLFSSWLASCLPDSKTAAPISEEHERLMTELSDSLSADPLFVCRQIDSILYCHEYDSLAYYSFLMLKAKAKMFLSEADSSMFLLRAAESYCSRHSSEGSKITSLYADVRNMKGNIFARNSAIDSAQVEFRHAYELSEKEDMYKRVNISLNLADAYVRGGKYDLGAYWYRHSLSLADSLQWPDHERFPIYYGLAQVNMELRDFELCDYFYDLAARYYDQMQPYEKHIYLNNRGNSYYFRQDYPTALDYFRRLLAFVQQYPEMEFERNLTMINLGEVFLLMNHTDSASYYLNRCHDFFSKMKNNTALYYIDTQLIELALKNGNVSQAREYLRNAVKPDYVEPNMIHIRNRYLQHYFEQSGDFKNAYLYQKKNQRIDDSTRNERIRMRVAEIALKYKQDSTLMQKEILIRQKQNEVLQLNQYLYRVILLAIAAGMALTAWFWYKKRKRDKAERLMRTAINSLRLENIRNRISPHFIFNVLNREVNLRKGTKEHDNLLGLVKLMRRNLELADSLCVTLAEELDFVKTYICLEEKTLLPDFVYCISIAPEVNADTVKIPSMLLQIPVENAIKHALRSKEGKRRLWIRIVPQGDGKIEIVVCDNGGGYRHNSIGKGTGTGMKVITQTIQLLNLYNTDSIVMVINNVSTEDGEPGCEIRFTIPLSFSYQLGRRINKK